MSLGSITNNVQMTVKAISNWFTVASTCVVPATSKMSSDWIKYADKTINNMNWSVYYKITFNRKDEKETIKEIQQPIQTITVNYSNLNFIKNLKGEKTSIVPLFGIGLAKGEQTNLVFGKRADVVLQPTNYEWVLGLSRRYWK